VQKVNPCVIPGREDAMAKGLGRTHFRYANYFQAPLRCTGHLWQNRFYSCPLSQSHLLRAIYT
jgi:putative transposase